MHTRLALPAALLFSAMGLLVGCTDEQKEKASQTTTTAASATQQKLETAADDATQELKKEWRDARVHVDTASTDAGAHLAPPPATRSTTTP